jgi:hypothetical protein
MDAALDSHFDLDSMYTYSPASKCSSALPHQPSQPPRYDQHEISGLIMLQKNKSSSKNEFSVFNKPAYFMLITHGEVMNMKFTG